jgi:hypothetical protein
MKNQLKEVILQRQFCWINAIREDDLLSNTPKLAQLA